MTVYENRKTMSHDTTQERLLEAAGQVFADRGFEGATVREICQRAEVNIAAINYYFRDKERLYIEAVKSACMRQAAQLPMPQWPPGTPALVKLRDFIHTFAHRILHEDDAEWCRQLFLREMSHPTDACGELVRDHIRPTGMVLSGILQELLPDVPEGKRRLIAFSIIGQCLFYRLAKPIVALMVDPDEYRTYTAERLAEHILQFTQAALGLDQTKTAPGKRASRRRKAAGPAEP
jgi:AcrR family transcriptional regulator